MVLHLRFESPLKVVMVDHLETNAQDTHTTLLAGYEKGHIPFLASRMDSASLPPLFGCGIKYRTPKYLALKKQ